MGFQKQLFAEVYLQGQQTKQKQNETHYYIRLDSQESPSAEYKGGKQGSSACVVLLSARDLISLLCVTVWSTGPGSNWPRVM